MNKIIPCLWFDTQALEAAEFYVSLFDNAEITHINRSAIDWPGGKAGDVILVEFTLAGQDFQGLNGGPDTDFNDAVSMSISCKDQDEVDRMWSALLKGGGQEIMCGWLKDKYGLRWQVVPTEFRDMLRGNDPEKNKRAMDAMGEMVKLDVDTLRAAYEG